MSEKPKVNEMSFTRPVIGPKDYVTTGPSQWPETFKRKDVDAKLAAFVGSLAPAIKIVELVDMFIAMREITEDQKVVDWFTIVGFIARQLGVHPKTVPHECAIAFWGLVVIASTARDAN